MAKNILLTGASRGIGFQLARLLVHQGHQVLAVARSQEGLARLASDCIDLEGKLITYQQDLNEVEKLVTEVGQKLKKVDVVLNNAAAFLKKNFGTLTLSELENLFKVNVFSPTLLIQALLPYYHKGAHVVNISSVGGVQGSQKFKGLLPYSSTKGALNIVTECLAVELAPHNIYCNALALGSAATEMFKEAFPEQKAGASANEMARYIAHFALKGAPLINGKVISVSHTNP
jgi:NAD(P)-dependent dehydrogenase (short-subunit alcohol dehydrogenase family)